MGYRIPDDPPDADLTPEQLHDRIDEVTNLTADELRAFKGSDFNQEYNRVKSDAAQPGDEPLDDVIRLLETPASEYREVDDGFNEIQQGRELLSFQRRTQAQIGSQGLGENYLTDLEVMQVREAVSIRWGIDPDEEREWL